MKNRRFFRADAKIMNNIAIFRRVFRELGGIHSCPRPLLTSMDATLTSLSQVFFVLILICDNSGRYMYRFDNSCVMIRVLYTLFFSAPPMIYSAIGANSTNSLQYRNIAQFMRATTNDISTAPEVSLLSRVRNPCFAVTSQHWNAVNISLQTAVEHHLVVKCLPYIYLLGK